jgi:hypothetical protein
VRQIANKLLPLPSLHLVSLMLGMICVLQGCLLERPMDTSEFWRLVASPSNNETGDGNADLLRERLLGKSPSEVLDFYLLFQERMRESQKGDIWAAAKLMNAGHCSDDCFEYFRCWLVSQGEDVFVRALQHADSLADVRVPAVENEPHPQDERYCYVAADVYKKMTNSSIFDDLRRANRMPHGSDSMDFDWQDYTNALLKKRLPNLWKKFGHYVRTESLPSKAAADQMSSVEVAGIGKITVGMSIRHKTFGVGVVEHIDGKGIPAAVIRFPDGARPVMLSADYIKRNDDSK